MEPSPDETVTGAAYGGSRLTGDLEAPGEYAFDGRGELATQPGAAPEQAQEDAEILGAIEEQGAWMIEVLARLVRAETTLGNEQAGQAIMRSVLREDLQLEPVDVPMDAEALRAHPHAAPFDWSLEGRSNVVATWEPGRPDEMSGRSLILNGHIDVVSPEPLGQWGAHDPFGADRDGEWMIGRGAADMKCGLAAIVGAVRGLRSLGLTPRAPVTIESVLEEECSGNGTLQTLLAGYTAEAAVIAEPFGAAITTSQVGVLWFSVRITGVPGHAAEGRNATNAIEKSLAVIGALRGLESDLNAAPPAPYDLFAHPINLNVGTIRGGDWPSTVPGECVTGYRIALYPNMTLDDLRARIEALVAEATADQPGSAEVHYNGFASHGYELADDHDLVTTLAGSFARQAGVPPAVVATTGTTDASVFGNVAGIPAVCFGPFAEAAHGVGERVYLPSVIQTAQVMGLFIRDWCGLSR
ncbi:MAG: ArgE/DapE family deacylase [Myxococcota bacterium]